MQIFQTSISSNKCLGAYACLNTLLYTFRNIRIPFAFTSTFSVQFRISHRFQLKINIKQKTSSFLKTALMSHLRIIIS